MRRDSPSAASVVLAGGAVIVAASLLSLNLPGAFHAGAFLLANYFFFTDLLDILLRVQLCRHHNPHGGIMAPSASVINDVPDVDDEEVSRQLRPYALLIAVHDAEDSIDDFIEAMAPLRDRIWMIDDASTDSTVDMLTLAGYRCMRSPVNRKKPGAIRELLRHIPTDIESVCVLDPDCRIDEGGRIDRARLERVIWEFQQSGRGAMSPRLAIRDLGFLPALQTLEFAISFSMIRRSMGPHCVTSGAAFYRRDALQRALERHDLSVYAEDLKNAILILDSGEDIYFDSRLVIRTEAKTTWRGWFSQRVGWYYGLLDTYATLGRRIWGLRRRGFTASYQHLFYSGVLTLALHPAKIGAVLLLLLCTANGLDLLFGLDLIPDSPWTEPTLPVNAYLQYCALSFGLVLFVVDRRDRWRLLPAAPAFMLYAILQTIPATVGYLNWMAVRLLGRRVYRDHYDDPGSDAPRPVGVSSGVAGASGAARMTAGANAAGSAAGAAVADAAPARGQR